MKNPNVFWQEFNIFEHLTFTPYLIKQNSVHDVESDTDEDIVSVQHHAYSTHPLTHPHMHYILTRNTHTCTRAWNMLLSLHTPLPANITTHVHQHASIVTMHSCLRLFWFMQYSVIDECTQENGSDNVTDATGPEDPPSLPPRAYAKVWTSLLPGSYAWMHQCNVLYKLYIINAPVY